MLLVIAGSFAWLFGTWQSEQRDTARLARDTVAADLLQNTEGQFALELPYLAALGVFDEPWPAVLEFQETTVAQLDEQFTREELIDIARRADRDAGRSYRSLERAGIRAAAPVREALIDSPDLYRRLEDGETPKLDARRYGDAWDWLLARSQDAQDRADSAQRALVAKASDQTPPWRHPIVLGIGLGVFALGVAIAFAFRMLVARALSRTEGERDRLAEQTTRLRSLIEAVRDFTSILDADALGDRIVQQAKLTVHGDFSALFGVAGTGLVPIAATGVEAECSEAGGVLARVIAGAHAARAVVPGEPGLRLGAPAGIVAAPLASHGRVVAVLVAGRSDAALATDDDETALTLLATCAAPALESAREHGDVTMLATIDPLTGLHNKRRLETDLTATLQSAVRAQRATSLMMIDVDHFKRFNDTHGHPAGDRALRRISGVVRACVREHDTVYRFGGEELCVLLPGAQLQDALVIAERIRAAVSVDAGHDDAAVTVSIGVAHTLDADEAELVRRADEALYAAKHAGRNRVEHAPA